MPGCTFGASFVRGGPAGFPCKNLGAALRCAATSSARAADRLVSRASWRAALMAMAEVRVVVRWLEMARLDWPSRRAALPFFGLHPAQLAHGFSQVGDHFVAACPSEDVDCFVVEGRD